MYWPACHADSMLSLVVEFGGWWFVAASKVVLVDAEQRQGESSEK